MLTPHAPQAFELQPQKEERLGVLSPPKDPRDTDASSPDRQPQLVSLSEAPQRSDCKSCAEPEQCPNEIMQRLWEVERQVWARVTRG